MSNAIIAYPDRAAATLSSGAWQAAKPRANLQTRLISDTARTADLALASTQWDVDHGSDKMQRVAAVIGHNLTRDARFRRRLSSVSDFSSVILDTGWQDVWPQVYDPLTLDFEDPRWGDGRYSDEDLAGYTWTLPQILAGIEIPRYERWEFDDQLNPAGYLDFGRLYIAEQWQASINLSYGHELVLRSNSSMSYTPGGVKWPKRRPAQRTAMISFDWLSVDEGLGRAFETMRRADIVDDVFYVYDPDDTLHMIRRAFLGTLKKLSPVRMPYLNTHSVAFEIEESI